MKYSDTDVADTILVSKNKSQSNSKNATSNQSEPKKATYKVLSLFTGCGGLDLGFKGGFKSNNREYSKNNFSVVLSNDILACATSTYANNQKYFGKHKVVTGDIKDIESSEIPDFDFMAAGFPCQPFSNAGLRKGINDDRGNLFEECVRILKEKEKSENPPKGFIFENVRGILSSKMEDGTTIPDEIVKRMDKLGYTTTYKLVKASNYGVPSARFRVIIVGFKKGLGTFNFELLDEVVTEHNLPNEKTNKYDLYVGSLLCDIPKKAPQRNDYWKYSPSGQYIVDKIGPCYGGKKELKQFKDRVPVEEMNEKVKKGRSWKVMSRDDMPERFQKIHDNPKKYRSPNFYRRFALAEISGTVIASAQPENSGITHPLENRRFSIREIARIQSFPDDFDFSYKTITHAYKVIGNAVPPVLGWVIAKAIEKHFETHENKS